MVSSLFSSLAVNSVFMPSMATVMKNFSDSLTLIKLPPKFHLRKYRRLWKHFAQRGLICIGIYRRGCTLAKTLGAVTSLGQVEHDYVICGPNADETVLRREDKIY